MRVREGRVVSNHNDKSSSFNSPSPSKTPSENECEIPCECDLLVVRRMLGKIPKLLDKTQRENIFQTHYLINNKLCSMIIDGDNCVNVTSIRVVEKLGLPIISHTKPYKLQWLSEKGEIKVSKQVLINFGIGKYKNEILCDVVTMEATHILLERPWKYDRQFLHDGHTNKISFNFHGHKVILKPLSPKEVHEDQIKMKNKRQNEKRDESKIGLNISPYTAITIMLTHAGMQIAPPRCSSSLSFSLPNKYPNT